MPFMADMHETGGQRFSWAALRRDDPDAKAAAERAADEIARALAVESLGTDPDGLLDELADRRAQLREAAWTDGARGFELRSSLGGFVLARVALQWVPTGQTGLRRIPLDRAGIVRGLVQHGVDETTAALAVPDVSAPDGFQPDLGGLDPSTLAGLAERSLTPEEERSALAQVAVSNRDLARFAACLNLMRACRRILAVLPADAHGARVSTLVALLAAGQAERVMEMADVGVPAEAGLVRLAEAALQLGRGDATLLEPPMGWFDAVEAAPEESEAEAPFDEDDDVLEIVEETVLEEDTAEVAVGVFQDWWGSAAPAAPLEWPEVPSHVWAQLDARRADSASAGEVFGLRPLADHERGGPLPPFVSEEGEAVADGLVRSAQWALSIIAACAEGRQLDAEAEARAGALSWVLARARCLACARAGDLEAAEAALDGLAEDEAAERGWVARLRARFDGREPPRIDVADVRRMGAGLASDVMVALARTLVGPTDKSDTGTSHGRPDA